MISQYVPSSRRASWSNGVGTALRYFDFHYVRMAAPGVQVLRPIHRVRWDRSHERLENPLLDLSVLDKVTVGGHGAAPWIGCYTVTTCWRGRKRADANEPFCTVTAEKSRQGRCEMLHGINCPVLTMLMSLPAHWQPPRMTPVIAL